ncbi:OTU domain-containing protein 5, partial [Irineochytrium annulatum]
MAAASPAATKPLIAALDTGRVPAPEPRRQLAVDASNRAGDASSNLPSPTPSPTKTPEAVVAILFTDDNNASAGRDSADPMDDSDPSQSLHVHVGARRDASPARAPSPRAASPLPHVNSFSSGAEADLDEPTPPNAEPEIARSGRSGSAGSLDDAMDIDAAPWPRSASVRASAATTVREMMPPRDGPSISASALALRPSTVGSSSTAAGWGGVTTPGASSPRQESQDRVMRWLTERGRAIGGSAVDLWMPDGDEEGVVTTGLTRGMPLVEWFDGKLRREKGLQVLYVVGDACSLFRSVADDLYGDQERHGDVRMECAEYMTQNAERFAAFCTIPFQQYVSRLRSLDVAGTDLELQCIADCFGVKIELHQTAGETIRMQPSPFSARRLESEERDPIRLCLIEGHVYHRLVPVSRPEGEDIINQIKPEGPLLKFEDSQHDLTEFPDNDEELNEAIRLSLLSQSLANPKSALKSSTRRNPTSPPPLASGSCSSMTNLQQPKIDRVLKLAASTLSPSSPQPSRPSNATSMDDDEFQTLQAVLEMSLREAREKAATAGAEGVAVDNNDASVAVAGVKRPPPAMKQKRRVSFVDGRRDWEEEEADVGGYDEDEALRMAIEASRMEMVEKRGGEVT